MSNPSRMYSARLPQVSILVNILKRLILLFVSKSFTRFVNFSNCFGLPPKLLLQFNSKLGLGSASSISNNLYVLCCIVGSPPVIRKICSSLLSSGHQRQNASKYGLFCSSKI